MYNRVNRATTTLLEEIEAGLQDFINFAGQNLYDGNRIWCPCKMCANTNMHDINRVCNHLYNKGFMPNYYVWTTHGEQLEHPTLNEGDDHMFGMHDTFNVATGDGNVYGYAGVDDHAGGFSYSGAAEIPVQDCDTIIEDHPNEETIKFFSALDAAQEPLYNECVERLSRFSFASDMMYVKNKHNVAEDTYDDFQRVFKHNLPEGNVAAGSYYEIEKVMRPLGMPYMTIDVCPKNCMIYWSGEDKLLMECKFCGTPRYKQQKRRTGRGEARPKPIAKKMMWYLPISYRLKRLYLSATTSPNMRWHAEHTRSHERLQHPSDAKAWTHFQDRYPDFAQESRNVYLGLCTYGFNPFGSYGANYSPWPIILTPYNLPPEMCMKREFLFLSILIPGPNHPKRSLDVFLQPLVEELKSLWSIGVEAYDVSSKQLFNLRAVLLWTISDFPAYGMLSGWTTHGKLSCPYCRDNTDSFQLENGKKMTWFDCHRRLLPRNHAFCKSGRTFRTRRIVTKGPPAEVSDEQSHHQVENTYGLRKTKDCGGSGHINAEITGYGNAHQWHKHSIFGSCRTGEPI